MNVEFKVHDEGFQSAMKRYVEELGYDSAEVFQRQMRLAVKELQNATHPKTLRQGKDAVERDISKAVSPITRNAWAGIQDPKIRKRLREVTSAGKYDAIRAILRNVTGKDVHVVPFSPSLHKSARDRYGRVRSSKNRYTADVEAWKAYVAKVKDRVGWAKAGWNAAAKLLGQATTAWVSRHTGGGEAYGAPDHSYTPNIVMVNNASKIPGYQKLCDYVIRMRERKMTIDIEQRLKRGAFKSGFKS